MVKIKILSLIIDLFKAISFFKLLPYSNTIVKKNLPPLLENNEGVFILASLGIGQPQSTKVNIVSHATLSRDVA